MKTTEEVKQFIERADKLYPFIGLGQKRIYADPRACALQIAYSETRLKDDNNEFPFMRGYVSTQTIADIVKIDRSGMYPAIKKVDRFYGLYPEFTSIYDDIKKLLTSIDK